MGGVAPVSSRPVGSSSGQQIADATGRAAGPAAAAQHDAVRQVAYAPQDAVEAPPPSVAAPVAVPDDLSPLVPPDPRSSQNVGPDPKMSQTQIGQIHAALQDESKARGVPPSQLGHRALEGLTNVDPGNLQYNVDPKTGNMSLTRDGREIWSSVDPGGKGGTAADWAVRVEGAGNAILRDYNRTYESGIADPTSENLFIGAFDAIHLPYAPEVPEPTT